MSAFLVDGTRPGRFDVACDEQHCPDTVAADLTLPEARQAVAEHDRDNH